MRFGYPHLNPFLIHVLRAGSGELLVSVIEQMVDEWISVEEHSAPLQETKEDARMDLVHLHIPFKWNGRVIKQKKAMQSK